MYCQYCGKEVKDKAVVCTECGHPIESTEGKTVAGEPWSLLVMAGLVAATLFVPPIGLVFGVMGLMDEARKVQGAILTTVAVFMTLLMTAIILGL
jgi:hypothetical protein